MYLHLGFALYRGSFSYRPLSGAHLIILDRLSTFICSLLHPDKVIGHIGSCHLVMWSLRITVAVYIMAMVNLVPHFFERHAVHSSLRHTGAGCKSHTCSLHWNLKSQWQPSSHRVQTCLQFRWTMSSRSKIRWLQPSWCLSPKRLTEDTTEPSQGVFTLTNGDTIANLAHRKRPAAQRYSDNVQASLTQLTAFPADNCV